MKTGGAPERGGFDDQRAFRHLTTTHPGTQIHFSPSPHRPPDAARNRRLFCMSPCTLLREDCLVGDELAHRLHLQRGGAMAMAPDAMLVDEERMSSPASACGSGTNSLYEVVEEELGFQALSPFERIITSYPPILESLVQQLPTSSLIDLYHTSEHLRSFLSEYPLAWRSLSFRLPQPAVTLASPGNDSPDGRVHQSKQNAMDDLLLQIVIPFGTRLKNLDLCNTAVNGVSLMVEVLPQTKATLKHLSVRGCKNVSIKYHILPFLQIILKGLTKVSRVRNNGYALQSLYTYRCRHHRRRAYLPSSLLRRDSDSEPTHDLIEICHQLGIWTDTAWCPTPGPRCFRRRDYYTGRAAPGTTDVWVPFDRLWRSGNRIGPSDEESHQVVHGKLWEEEEGYAGEALGTTDQRGEGKETPTHLRRTHRAFVEGVKCDQCHAEIQERCEQCSVKMHCMGCRKTLCASCAFDRPLPQKHRAKRRQTDFTSADATIAATLPMVVSSFNSSVQSSSRHRAHSEAAPFWWAPGATRSPNQIHEAGQELDGSDDESDASTVSTIGNSTMQPARLPPPKLNMHWCCLEPVFSGGGGVAFIGPNVAGPGSDAIRATPLPQKPEFTDPDFLSGLFTQSPGPRRVGSTNPLHDGSPSSDCSAGPSSSSLQVPHIPPLSTLYPDPSILPYLQQQSLDLSAVTCPRSLCTDCYRSFRWKISCRACRRPICREHDLRALKVRKCGYRDMRTEHDWVRDHERQRRRMEVRRARIDRTEWSQNKSSLVADMRLEWETALNSNNSTSSASANAPPMETSRSSQRALSPASFSSSSRPRSLSLGGQRATPAQPIPGHPQHPVQWQGCGAFFCQQFRPPGDSRPRCTAAMQQCVECGVLVCQPCTTRYHCPACAQLPAARAACRLLEEQAARIAEEAAKRKAEEQKRQQEALAVTEEEGLREMKLSDPSGQHPSVQRSFSMFGPFGGAEVNGIPEGQMWTFGFMLGGAAPAPSAVLSSAPCPSGETLAQIEQMAIEFQQANGSSSLVASKSSAAVETAAEVHASTGPDEQNGTPDHEGVDLALGVGEFFNFLESTV
ncbi:MAG: hypothetical protein M1821_003880 [Bathelium mastoideum]|nr:MAG: hypothetical protein M1821_003880 [Bathelium mastoideum]